MASPSAFIPSVDQSVFELRPDFRLVSLSVSGFFWGKADDPEVEKFVRYAEEQALVADSERDAHLLAWSETYNAFGSKPKRFPCSADALLKRTIRDGVLPRINPLVDVYNAVSILHGLPVGGEDQSHYRGCPRLTRADGSETFDTTKNGEPHTENPDAGEVIWRDEAGVTCRRWNWRQGTRTRIEEGASELWFVLEALHPLPAARLEEATDQMVHLIKTLSPSAIVETLNIINSSVGQLTQ